MGTVLRAYFWRLFFPLLASPVYILRVLTKSRVVYWCCGCVEWVLRDILCLLLTAFRTRLFAAVRQFLGKVMSSSGCLLLSPSLPQAAGPEGHSALLSEASLVSLGSSDGGWQGGEETPLGSPGVPQHPTGPAGESTATLGAPTEAAAAGAATKSKTEDAEEDAALATPVADDPWLHMPKTKPICVKEFSLSGRLPARQVSLHSSFCCFSLIRAFIFYPLSAFSLHMQSICWPSLAQLRFARSSRSELPRSCCCCRCSCCCCRSLLPSY